jgi:hypothetical protein
MTAACVGVLGHSPSCFGVSLKILLSDDPGFGFYQ